VPVDAVEMWRESFAASPESSLQVMGDERMAAGECVLETNVGRVELGVSAQLEEIERGFFDLMQQRPA
jgi:flagellar assembly protein FliH